MKTLRLDTSGLEVSSLCLGCMMFGTMVEREVAFDILDAYYSAGGRFLDTANNYAFWVDGGKGGESEHVIGEWLKARGCRNEMVIATKLGAMPRSAGQGFERPEGLSAGIIRSALDESLARMGLDHIDLLYSHLDDRTVALEETLGTFDALIKQGKVRAIGASNHCAWRLERARYVCNKQGYAQFDAVQQRFSYLMPQRSVDLGIQKLADPDFLDYLHTRRDLALVGYSILLKGTYNNNVLKGAYDTKENAEKLKILSSLSEELEISVNQLVLAWAIRSAPVSIPLIATSRPEHLDELLAVSDIKLTQEIMNYLNKAGKKGV